LLWLIGGFIVIGSFGQDSVYFGVAIWLSGCFIFIGVLGSGYAQRKDRAISERRRQQHQERLDAQTEKLVAAIRHVGDPWLAQVRGRNEQEKGLISNAAEHIMHRIEALGTCDSPSRDAVLKDIDAIAARRPELIFAPNFPRRAAAADLDRAVRRWD
jgi:hypothetical protein